MENSLGKKKQKREKERTKVIKEEKRVSIKGER